jgi:hypothetical protein
VIGLADISSNQLQQQVNDHGNEDLRLAGVLIGPQECFDLQVLLNQLEEDLPAWAGPASFIQFPDSSSRTSWQPTDRRPCTCGKVYRIGVGKSLFSEPKKESIPEFDQVRVCPIFLRSWWGSWW